MTDELVFTVTIIARSGKVSELKSKVLSLLEFIRQSSGCLQYDIYQEKGRTDVFVVFERWESRAHWLNNMETEVFKAFLEENPKYVADFEIKELQRISFSS
ncbi:putative quinol monooxygenase [Marinomonas transparens]|uniref:Antibiotic biosynthesis monooxygenase n=1 Tax=Marinomonas transparens TaxID=2795388 RepID=A0A934JXW4_9GAMM|nr:putative quinol monooxygenase [Marinomonas transparens]MBJ7538962.1 antibiotic biosynthesis monooxygenase [Marinomonas transparens]